MTNKLEGGPPANVITLVNPIFCSYDIDGDPMTLIYELDLIIQKMDPHTSNEAKAFRS